MRRFCATFLLVVAAIHCKYSDAQVPQAGELAERAVKQSQLTLPGSAPFHLRASIVEVTNPDSEYKGELEEYWISPEKYRRTITSPTFSQTLVVNGDKVFEDDKGDYFPWWLNNLAKAVVEPLPKTDVLKSPNLQMGYVNFSKHTYCFQMWTKIGNPPAESKEFWYFCFDGNAGLLQSVVTPGFDAWFEDFQDFKKKHIARTVGCNPEPGTRIELKVTELEEIKKPDESMFAVTEVTPAEHRIATANVPDATVRTLAKNTPDILWPTLRSGQTTGVVTMYVSIDREGHVRETWPLVNDNEGLQDVARKQVKNWQFKIATIGGVPMQVESVMIFPFSTKIADPIPILSDAEGRKQATKIVEPDLPPGTLKGTEVKVQVGISPDGTMNGVNNPYNVPTPLFLAAYRALGQWQFTPCMRDGKPDACSADIIFRAP